jgi:hypothetical protein
MLTIKHNNNTTCFPRPSVSDRLFRLLLPSPRIELSSRHSKVELGHRFDVEPVEKGWHGWLQGR